jgi:Uma2 family endonuclease
MAAQPPVDYPPVPADYEPPRRVGLEEYHRLADQLAGRYEYHGGLMYPRFYPPGSNWAMAGGTEAHDQITLNLHIEIGLHVRTLGRCRLHTSDLLLEAGAHEYYPDAYVTCDDAMQPGRRRMQDATLVCEVRSQSTAEFDRNEKFEAYKLLPGLQEYLILDNRRPEATLYRMSGGNWLQITCTEGTDIRLESIGLVLPLNRIYAGLTLDPDPTR